MCVRACACVRVYVCVYARVCVCVCARGRAHMHAHTHADSPVIFMSGDLRTLTLVSFPATNVMNERVIAPHGWRSCWHFMVSVRANRYKCVQTEALGGLHEKHGVWTPSKQGRMSVTTFSAVPRYMNAPGVPRNFASSWLSESVGAPEQQVAILNSCRTNLSVCLSVCLCVHYVCR